MASHWPASASQDTDRGVEATGAIDGFVFGETSWGTGEAALGAGKERMGPELAPGLVTSALM